MAGGYFKKKCCRKSSSSSSSSSTSSRSLSSTSAILMGNCPACRDNLAPQIWRVEINVINGTGANPCATCPNYSGIYYIDANLDTYSVGPGDLCLWRKDIGFNCNPCEGAEGPPRTYLHVFVSRSGGNAIFNVDLLLDQPNGNMVRWQKIISGAGDWNCCGMDNEAIPFLTNFFNQCGPFTGTICLGSGPAIVTALGC